MKSFYLSILLAAIPAAATDLHGVWHISASVQGQEFPIVCSLNQHQEKITGSCKIEGQQVIDVVGTVKSDQIMLQGGSDDGGTKTILTFNGTLSSPTDMKGEIYVDPYEMHGVFNARLGSDPAPAVDHAATPPQPAAPPMAPEKPVTLDAGKDATLYVVPYAHLDTEWRWEYPTVIGEYLSRTMRDNFALLEKYPHFIFNFSGANRYRLMKEYYPSDYQKIQKYAAAGRWFPAGSSMEENDVNNPSAESIIRQILYGKEFFRRDFGKTSAEYMLPDCFGFPASLPSILSHTGIKGFSTQKLTWHSATTAGGPGSPQDTAKGIPFNVGTWVGLDGKTVIAALNATDYGGNVTEDLSKSNTWISRAENVGKSSGIYVDYRYYGTGDIGGSPRESSVKLMEAIVTQGDAAIPNEAAPKASPQPVKVGDGPLHVKQTTAEQMFLDIKPKQAAHLPRYSGDLELTEHSAGSLTSEAYMKRWNRENEVLADAAERASVAADWMGGRPYPRQRITDAWTLVMGGQFHDLIPGTATPKAYEFAWNDQNIALNQFGQVLQSAVNATASGLNTQVKGTAVVVYNPLSISREDVVEAQLTFVDGSPKGVRVVGPDGKDVASQLGEATKNNAKVIFLAKMPSVGYAVYDIQPTDSVNSSNSTLRVTESSLENSRYLIKIDTNGDVSSIYDKTIKHELLSAPARLAIKTDKPAEWPAWNMDWTDQQKPPRGYVSGPAKIKIVENGPARVALQIVRETEGSNFEQTIRLGSGGAGDRVEFSNIVNWQTSEANLKATFPLTASNPKATYNWDIGKIERGNNDERKFEVASHQWFDLTDVSGGYGVAILSDYKHGSDKPDDHTLRLTLLRTPGISQGGMAYNDQATQDWGRHEFKYGIASHGGDWQKGEANWQGIRLNQPLIAFQSPSHDGTLGKSFSLLSVNNSHVRVMALKKAEQSDEIVVRLIEETGRPQNNVRLTFPSAVAAAREINGAEEEVGAATIAKGDLVTEFTPFQPRTFAIKLATTSSKLLVQQSQSVELPYDVSIASTDGHPSTGGFDDVGHALPAELLPATVAYDGIEFKLAPAAETKPSAMTAGGQTITLPTGKYNRLYLLAAAYGGDQKTTFQVDDKSFDLTIQNWTGFIGQWDDRIWKTVPLPPPATPTDGDDSNEAKRARRTLAYIAMHGPITGPQMVGLTPGFVKKSPVAWYASHSHGTDGTNQIYAYSYLYAYTIDLPSGAKTLTLPKDERIRILALTIAQADAAVQPAQPLYDTLERGTTLMQ
jgi:alpha-mannosidase